MGAEAVVKVVQEQLRAGYAPRTVARHVVAHCLRGDGPTAAASNDNITLVLVVFKGR